MKAISTVDGLYEVLTDVVNKHPKLIGRIIDDAQIDSGSVELHKTDIQAWSDLARHGAFPLTFENVRDYIKELGDIDINLGGYLSKVLVVSGVDDVAQADRQVLALDFLKAESTIPHPGQRVDLVGSLKLQDRLQPELIPNEGGNLIGLLIKSEILEDNVASYRLTLDHDWTTKESAILASKEFVNFMDPAQIPVSDLLKLLRSTKIDSAIKDKLIERFDEFISTDDAEALKEAAEYAVNTRKDLSFEIVSRISAANIDKDLTLELVALNLPRITADQLTQLGGDVGIGLKKLLACDGTRQKIENTEANKTIAEYLKKLGLVSSIKDKGSEIQVNLKKS